MRTRPLCSFTSSRTIAERPTSAAVPVRSARRLLDVADGDRADEAESRPGRDDERGQLDREINVKRPDHGRDHGRDRDNAEGERYRHELGNTEHGRHDQPDDPGLHGRSAECFCC